MDVDDVGTPRFCAACGASAAPYEYDIEEVDANETRCSICERPSMACPCEPRSVSLT